MTMQDNEHIWGLESDELALASALPEGGEDDELSEEELDGVAGGGDMPPQEPIDPHEEPPEFPPASDDPNPDPGPVPPDPGHVPPEEEPPKK